MYNVVTDIILWPPHWYNLCARGLRQSYISADCRVLMRIEILMFEVGLHHCPRHCPWDLRCFAEVKGQIMSLLHNSCKFIELTNCYIIV